jgi:hypothetical protein
LQGFLAVRRLCDGVNSRPSDPLAQHVTERVVIVDDENPPPGRWLDGRARRNMPVV